jgi:hypothetical protein
MGWAQSHTLKEERINIFSTVTGYPHGKKSVGRSRQISGRNGQQDALRRCKRDLTVQNCGIWWCRWPTTSFHDEVTPQPKIPLRLWQPWTGSENGMPFMKPESSLSCTQHPATAPYSELTESRTIGLILDSIHHLVCRRQKTTTFRRLDLSPSSGG